MAISTGYSNLTLSWKYLEKENFYEKNRDKKFLFKKNRLGPD